MIEYTDPKGPWQTRIASVDGKQIAMIRKVPHAGYQVIANSMVWQGLFGATNTKFFSKLKDAKGCCDELAGMENN
jgi:hypothetical protein